MADSNWDNLIEDYRENEISVVSDELEALYTDASIAMEEKLNKYLDDVVRRNTNMLDLLDSGEITQSEYNQWFYNQTIISRDWSSLRDELAYMATKADLSAGNIINKGLPAIYAEARNMTLFAMDIQSKGKLPTSFSLYNEKTVLGLVKDKKITLPYAHPDAGKSFKWNQQKINSVVSHSILTGDSTKKIAKSLETVCGMDKNSALRNARTSHNSAQNQANFDTCIECNKKGIPMVIQWSSARDARTRDSHIMLEGDEVKAGEEFKNGLRFPLDIEKGYDKPQEIYNCRCKGLTFLAGIDHSKDIAGYDSWMKENYYEDWKKARFNDDGSVRDIWKGENPNVARLKAEAKARQEEKARRAEEKARKRAEEIKRIEREMFTFRTYDSQIAKKYGQEHYDSICDIIENCPDEDVKAFWQTYVNDINVLDSNYKGTAYCSSLGIKLNVNGDSQGNSYERPYAVTFHEGGHYLDRMYGRDKIDYKSGIISSFYSVQFENNAFGNSLKKEAEALVNKYDKKIKQEFKEHINDYEWLYQNEYINHLDYKSLLRTGKTWSGKPVKYEKKIAYKFVERELYDLNSYQRSDISDMFEGATKGKVSAGYGHGKSYWSNPDNLPIEAFAEMTSATLAQGESLESIKKYFPESYDIYKRMVKSMI